MFILSKIQDVIQIEPADFVKPTRAALEDNINEQYANKVIQGIGLAICMWDLVDASEGQIRPGSGTANHNVIFRLLVFRPFQGEIIEAKIISSTATGIRVGLDFFDDITVPAPGALFEPSALEVEQTEEAGGGGGVATWVWTNEGVPYYFDRNERVRLRVEDEIWQDQAPNGAGLQQQQQSDALAAAARGDNGEGEGEQERARALKSPWRIVGSMQQGGLGVVSWWMDVEGDGDGGGGSEAADEDNA